MDDKQTEQYLGQQGAIVTDLAMRCSAVERLLIKKNIITEPELIEMLTNIRDELMDMIKANLEKAAQP